MYAHALCSSQATRWPVQAIAACYLLLLLLSVPGLRPATCRQLIRGRKLRNTQAAAAAAETGYFPPEVAISSQTRDTSDAAAPTGMADGSPLTGTSSSSSTAASSQAYSFTGATSAANTDARTYRHPCSYPDACKHYGRCVPYGWTFTCTCAEGWGGWYCEKPVAARSTLLATIPSVPRLAPQPGYSSSTPTKPSTFSTLGYPTDTSTWSTPLGMPAASIASNQLVSSTDVTTADALSSSGNAFVYNAAAQQNVLAGDAGAAVRTVTWPAAAAAAAARPLRRDTGNVIREDAPGAAVDVRPPIIGVVAPFG